MTSSANHADVQRVGVGVAVDSNGLDPQLARCSHNTTCNLTAVGDQDLVEHLGRALLRHIGQRPADKIISNTLPAAVHHVRGSRKRADRWK